MGKFSFYHKILLGVTGIAVFTAASFLLFDFNRTQERFPAYSYIGKVEVTGLNKTEAIKKLQSVKIEEAFEPLIYFVTTGESFALPPSETGMYIDAEKTVKQAFSLSKKENYLKTLGERLAQKALIFPLEFDADILLLQATIKELASRVESDAIDATIDLDEKTGAYHITEDFPGRRLDPEATILAFYKRLKERKNTFNLVFEYYEFPRVTEAVLRNAPPVFMVSQFTTFYGAHDSPNRIHNIKLIASWINNTLLMPGETFSLAKVLGKVTPARGYKEAYVIVGDVLVPQYGGGACQIGTTLYNTVEYADLEILSRRNHSLYFNIYPLGRDATVYPGQVDFKFKNDSGAPVLIKSQATNKRLRFRIYGTPSGKTVKIYEPKVFVYTRKGLVETSRWAALKSNAPFRTVVKKEVYDEEGRLLYDKLIKSYYKLYGDGTNVRIIRREPR